MKIMWQGTVYSVFFLLQLQCGNSALKFGAVRKDPSAAESRQMATHHEISHPSSSRDAFAGSRRLRYLMALQAWQTVTRAGVRCPKPQPCECHCDCPDTVVKKPPKPPTLCPMLPSFGTPPPPPTTTTAAPPPPMPPKPEKCKLGEVALSDGTCTVITTELLDRIEQMVAQKKSILDELLKKYATLYQPKCVSCPGATEYFHVRAMLLEAHKEYAAVLKFFMNAFNIFEGMQKKTWDGGDNNKGPEFVPGVKKLRPHCEPWTVNDTKAPGREMCGVVCRNQLTCMGFAMDESSGWCLWFDDAKPQSEAVCSSQTETEYIRMWEPKIDTKVWTTMKKLQVFDKAIITSLKVADVESDGTSVAYEHWTDFEGKNSTLKKDKEDKFKKNLDKYTGTLFDTVELRKQYLVLQRTAYDLVTQEAKAKPPFPLPPDAKKEKAVEIKPMPNGFAPPPPEQEPPSLVKWKDFPNSQDTAWSELHPDCPQGVPCVCDCKCRGAPPQNFVEPPPVPTTPCPQFPSAMANPFMFSAAGGR